MKLFPRLSHFTVSNAISTSIADVQVQECATNDTLNPCLCGILAPVMLGTLAQMDAMLCGRNVRSTFSVALKRKSRRRPLPDLSCEALC